MSLAATQLELTKVWYSIFYYDHGDWLGTERARTDLSGNPCEKIASLPFGDKQESSGEWLCKSRRVAFV
jgi:hypothetical protein